MMDSIKTQIWNLLSEPDNKTLCPIRIAGIVALVEWLTMAVMSFVQSHTFDPVSFGTGFGALVAGVGVALGIKTNSPIN